ncbi:zf-TFIIB domain-containing protein, partial [Chloroflexota bacterium]
DMVVVEYHDIELDYCTSCKGTWFDAGELELLLESQGMETVKMFLDGIFESSEASLPEKKRKCPICGLKMKKTAIGKPPGICIDMCRDEHGLWFDGGEVRQLMKHIAGEHLPEPDSGGKVISFLEELFEAPEGDS